MMCTSRGEMSLSLYHNPPPPSELAHYGDFGGTWTIEKQKPTDLLHEAQSQFENYHGPVGGFFYGGSEVHWSSGVTETLKEVILPIPALVLLFALSPVVALIARRRGSRRRMEGHCKKCGYDLRASSERCPECGYVRGSDIAGN